MADVDTPSAAYDAMKDKWHLVRALMGGTKAMRTAEQMYLPKFPGENFNVYTVRLARAVLTNVFRRTVRTLVGKVFSNPVSLGDDMPPQMAEWAENIDLQGNHLNVFARRVFRDGLAAGLTHILVEFPRMRPGLTLADERASGARPYFVHVKAEDAIFARHEIVGSREILTHLRLRENTVEGDGEWGEATRHRIRVFDRIPGEFGPVVSWRLFEKVDQDWSIVDDGVLSIPEIPFVTLYFDRTGFMMADLPLEDLAHLNVLHWQSASDHHHALTYARFPIVKAMGMTEDEMEKVVVGPSQLVGSSNENAKLDYLEHTGAAFASGRQELEDLKSEMDLMALEPMLPRRSGDVTATGRALDEAQANSALQAWAMATGDALEQGFMLAGMYVNLDGGSVEMNTDFGLSPDQQADIEALLKMRALGDISRETLYAELKRRNVMSDDVDADEEAERISAEGPAVEEEDDPFVDPELVGAA